MTTITKLELEQVGDDLCLVLSTEGRKFRGIMGRMDPAKLEAMSKHIAEIADRYRKRNDLTFRATCYEC